MSNALRFMQCLPFGWQSKFYQPPLNYTSIGSRVLSLFAAVSMLLASLLGFSAVAVAEEEEVIEEVVVTGSRLTTNPNLAAATPVLTVVGEEGILRGNTRIEDFINIMPQVFGDQASEVSNTATGTAALDLRGLGDVRTLVLIDGRRLPYGSSQTSAQT